MIRRSIAIAAALAAAVLGADVASAQSKGEWVLGRWQGGAYWFPAVVEKVSGGSVSIVYDDGDRETTTLEKVRPYDWAVGKKVECNYKGRGEWYSGRISALGGEMISINYDDGDKERTKTGRCRSR